MVFQYYSTSYNTWTRRWTCLGCETGNTSLTFTSYWSRPCMSSGKRVKKLSIMDAKCQGITKLGEKTPKRLRFLIRCRETTQMLCCFPLVINSFIHFTKRKKKVFLWAPTRYRTHTLKETHSRPRLMEPI